MLTTLRFVRGAVSTKEMIPILTAFHIYEGRIQGTNGRLTIDAPCPELAQFDVTIKAEPFLKACDVCEGEPKLTLEGAGKLKISRGGFKATLPLEDHTIFPKQNANTIEGIPMTAALLPALKVLLPFIGEDASRPWACGVLFDRGRAYATNNAILAGVDAYKFDQAINLPFFLVEELLRIGEEPVSANIDLECNSISFAYSNGAWIKSQLLASDWPDVAAMLSPEDSTEAIPTGLARAVERIIPFCPDKKIPIINFTPDGIMTMDGDKSACISEYPMPLGAYRAEPLLLALKSASHASFSDFPAAIQFSGPGGLRGIMMGIRI